MDKILVGFLLISTSLLVENRQIVSPGKKSNYLSKWEKPKFCRNLDCPPYKKVPTNSTEYEVRIYGKSNWVSTNILGMDYKEATRENFMRLLNYISGENKERKKIKMTAPVITRILPGQGPACKSDFTMSFYVAEKNPPAPSNSTVFLNTMPEMKAYVRSFGGFASDYKKWFDEAVILTNAIKDKTKYRHDFYYTAGYDSPFRLFDRHNEVWFLAN